MLSALVSAAVLLSGSVEAPEVGGVGLTEFESTLKTEGFDIIHRAEDNGRIVIGTRSEGGWAVIHSLSACADGRCGVWTLSAPLGSDFVETAITPDQLSDRMINRPGNSLMASTGADKTVSLSGSILGVACDSTCQAQTLRSFAMATKASYRSLAGDPAAAGHTGFGGQLMDHGLEKPVEMNPRQIAAIVTITEQTARPETVSSRTTTRHTAHAENGTISFPPLLPE